ncbi:MAG TPA: transcriptional repressor NrdR [Clostridiales bacterium]|nr:transcriptional repressor NrdR [Clostridiales bacterium]
MKCPFCNTADSKVVDSRPTDEGSVIRRRRECIKCGKRFTTYEKIEYLPILVVKKDGRREAFDSNKIMTGLLKACEKRPVSVRDLEAAVQDIEKQVYNSLEQEVTSKQIGEMVMEKLKALDEVAFVRFASVYRQFKDINTFMDELKKLLEEK